MLPQEDKTENCEAVMEDSLGGAVEARSVSSVVIDGFDSFFLLFILDSKAVVSLMGGRWTSKIRRQQATRRLRYL
jgi:hypothetical protein